MKVSKTRKTRNPEQALIKRKEAARTQLAKKYVSAQLKEESLLLAMYSIGDNSSVRFPFILFFSVFLSSPFTLPLYLS